MNKYANMTTRDIVSELRLAAVRGHHVNLDLVADYIEEMAESFERERSQLVARIEGKR